MVGDIKDKKKHSKISWEQWPNFFWKRQLIYNQKHPNL